VVGEGFKAVCVKCFKKNNKHDTIAADNPRMSLLSTPCIINMDNVFDDRLSELDTGGLKAYLGTEQL
jgi:hypothetical protein